MKKIKILLIALSINLFYSCESYLDIVPDNIATIDHAFNMRTTAERFLFTCYSYMPRHGNHLINPAFCAGDEFWLPTKRIDYTNSAKIARGSQNSVDPLLNFWQGNQNGLDLYEGIRQCNIFFDNIDKVPDLKYGEKERWVAEAKFLKAYYHYWLVKLYGPVPLIKENVSVNASYEKVYPTRNTVDECFEYIVSLIDEATPNLPIKVENELEELGRMTQTIALSVKAEILVTAASPFYNGNNDYIGFKNKHGQELFNTVTDNTKWEKAAKACEEAVLFAETQGHELYKFNPSFFQYELSDTIKLQMDIRHAICEKWNKEIIWGNSNSLTTDLQKMSTPRGLDPRYTDNGNPLGALGVPLKIVELFYSKNGVPITEDKYYDYANRYTLRVGDEENRLYIREGYTTSSLNFDREPRFYADLCFDGGIWYGQGMFNDKADLLYITAKKGQAASVKNIESYSVTGYWPKKLVHFNNVISSTSYTVEQYPWPVIRLANLYLLYAEALNEVNGPTSDVHEYVNRVRARAGLETIEDSWKYFSRNPEKYTTQAVMRSIIHQERSIELAFEAQRFWDMRRWKDAILEFNKPIQGWDVENEDAGSYYRVKTIFNQQYTTRDFLWPIRDNELWSNKNLNQSPGW